MRITPIKRKKWLIIALIGAGVLLLTGVALVLLLVLRPAQNPTQPSTQQPITQPTPSLSETRVKFAAMGDMLAHDTIINNAKTTDGYDFGRYFSHIYPSYQDADIVFCNQEGPSGGSAYGITGYPSFNAPLEFAEGLHGGAGCNFINLANNHMGDKGVTATNATINTWQKLSPLALAGANKSAKDQNKVSYATVKGVKFALLGFADFNNNSATPAYSVNTYHDTTLVRNLVKKARAGSDIVVVSMHWGTEDSAVVNADQKAQVDLLASLGVDVIVGTGPHVLQKTQIVKRPDGGKLIVWYSLGNMLSSQLNIPELFSGIATFTVVKPANGDRISIKDLGFMPTYMHYEWSAVEAAAGDLLARKNVMIYPLSEAAKPLARSQLHTTVAAQRQYIIQVLGPKVTVQ